MVHGSTQRLLDRRRPRATARPGVAATESAIEPAGDQVLALQQTLGNQAVQRALAGTGIPAPLLLSQQSTLGNQAVLRLLAGAARQSGAAAPAVSSDRPHQAQCGCPTCLGPTVAPDAPVPVGTPPVPMSADPVSADIPGVTGPHLVSRSVIQRARTKQGSKPKATRKQLHSQLKQKVKA